MVLSVMSRCIFLVAFAKVACACQANQLGQMDEISAVCCEGTAASDCTAGFPSICTRACAELLGPFWVSFHGNVIHHCASFDPKLLNDHLHLAQADCGPIVSMIGDVYPLDERDLQTFAEGEC
eukprot:SAG11_NODE_4685_length_1807_cov_1.410422_2_plen_123_part_00